MPFYDENCWDLWVIEAWGSTVSIVIFQFLWGSCSKSRSNWGCLACLGFLYGAGLIAIGGYLYKTQPCGKGSCKCVVPTYNKYLPYILVGLGAVWLLRSYFLYKSAGGDYEAVPNVVGIGEETVGPSKKRRFKVVYAEGAVMRNTFDPKDAKSKIVGTLDFGKVVEAAETKPLPATGMLRVRFDGSKWVSLAAGDGTPLLEELSKEKEAARPATPVESDEEAEPDVEQPASAKPPRRKKSKAANSAPEEEAPKVEKPKRKKSKGVNERKKSEPGKPRRRKSKAAVGAEGAGRNFKVVYGEGTVLRDTIDPKAKKSKVLGHLDHREVITALETEVLPSGILRVKCDRGWVSTTAGDGTALLAEVDAAGEEFGGLE